MDRPIRIVAAILVVIWSVACAPVGPQAVTKATTGPELAADQARLFLMREYALTQAPVQAEVELNGVPVATLRHKEFTYVDVPAGKYLLSVAGVPNNGAWRVAIDVGGKQALYLLILPNRRIEERNSLFPDSRKFDLQGGPFIVRTTDAETGEGTLREMTYRKADAATVTPAKG